MTWVTPNSTTGGPRLSWIAFPWASGVGMEMRTVRYMGLDEDAGDSNKGTDGDKPGATE